MPRRQQRRPSFRPPRRDNRDRSNEQAAIDAGARRVLANHSSTSLEALVHDLRLLRDEADRVAFETPSPEALTRYRRAVRELAEAERAQALLQEGN